MQVLGRKKRSNLVRIILRDAIIWFVDVSINFVINAGENIINANALQVNQYFLY